MVAQIVIAALAAAHVEVVDLPAVAVHQVVSAQAVVGALLAAEADLALAALVAIVEEQVTALAAVLTGAALAAEDVLAD